MANSSDNVPLPNPEATTYRYVTNGIYEVIGISGVLFNGLVVVCSIPSKNVQTMLIIGLAIADLINALAYLCYGLRGLIVSTIKPFYMAPFQCMLQGIHLTFFEVGEAASTWFTVFITVDRLLAMVLFTKYRNLGTTYIRCIFGFVITYTLVDVAVSFIGSALLDQVQKNPARCGHPQSVPLYYYNWHTITIICCGYGSTVIYACALVILKLRQKNTGPDTQVVEMKRESTVTKKIARIVLTTFILQIIPLTIYTTDIGDAYFFDLIGPYVWGVYALTPSVNVFMYSSNNQEFREKLKKMLNRLNQVGQSNLTTNNQATRRATSSDNAISPKMNNYINKL